MFGSIIESLLPGTRNIRPPLFSGLLWTLFLWVLLHDDIPNEPQSHQFLSQALSISATIGPFTTGVIGVAIIFSIGALMNAGASWVVARIGSASKYLHQRRRWQQHAHTTRRRIEAQIESFSEELSRIANHKDGGSNVKYLESQIEELRGSLSSIETRLGGLVIRQTAPTTRVIRPPSDTSDRLVASRMISGIREESADSMLQSLDLQVDIPAIRGGFERRPRTLHIEPANENLAGDLLDELKPDPLDALRAADNELYLELDRERTEREVRLSIAFPATALSIMGVAVGSTWWGIVTILGIIVVLRYSAAQSGEAGRILRLMSIKGIETPQTRQAAILGRDDVRSYLGKNSAGEEGKPQIAS